MANINFSQGEIEEIQLGIANLILIEKKKDNEDRERIDYLKKLIKKIENSKGRSKNNENI